MENENGLNFETFNPAAELKLSGELLSSGAVNGPAPAAPMPGPEAPEAPEAPMPGPEAPATGGKVPTDYKGRAFDPEIHMTDADGKPLIQNKNIRIKKGIKQKIKEVFTGKEEEKADFSEQKADFPQSDHEREKEVRENLAQAQAHAAQASEVDIHADDAANTAWIVYSAALGPEAFNQYEKLNPRLKKHFEIFEKRTGKSVDLPPGVALAVGLATVGFEIVRAEPECKKRFETARDYVASNVSGYFKKDSGPTAEEIKDEDKTDA